MAGAVLQQESEPVYFNSGNHGVVQKIILDPEKKLSRVSIEAIANEVIIGILGINISRK